MKLWLEIKGKIDSDELWARIESYDVNLTDMGNKSLVYGDVSAWAIGQVVALCSLYGDLDAKVYEGGAKNVEAQEKEGEAHS